MNNMIVRMALLETGTKQWQLAKLLGKSESVLSRELRTELPEADQEEMARLVRVANDIKSGKA